MEKASTIGVDLAKNVMQVHVAGEDGSVLLRTKLSRDRLLPFLAAQPKCVVAMEACGSAHHWGREIGKLGHKVRLIAPNYVKPFVKRQKNDAADAEAICEAAQRPTMRFVAVKSETKQAAAMIFKTRDLLVSQRTQAINALRGHLMEFGIVAPPGLHHADKLFAWATTCKADLPTEVRTLCAVLVDLIRRYTVQIRAFDLEIAGRARRDEVAKRLMTIPGVGAVTATALESLAPPAGIFRKGRDFAAWMGLTPSQRSTGGKPRLGKTSKMGQRDLRRLLILGATAVVRWAGQHGAPQGSWLARMMEKKPRLLVAVALANKMARIAWAIMARGGVYRAPAAAA